jgi:hypothetical protein
MRTSGIAALVLFATLAAVRPVAAQDLRVFGGGGATGSTYPTYPTVYRLTTGLILGIGWQNLFNVMPDRNTTVNSFSGIQTFPRQSPFGMNGRTVYGRIGWRM